MAPTMRNRLAVAGVATVLLVLTGCSPVRPSVAASARAIATGPAGQLAFQLPQRATSFTPFSPPGSAEGMLAAAQFQPLVAASDGRIKPRLAKTWGTVDEGSRLIITLDRSQWSDGTRISSTDVIYTVEQHLRPANRSPLAPLLRRIKGATEFAEGRSDRVSGVVADSNLSLVVDLAAPNRYPIDMFSQMMVLPAHIYRGQDLSDPKAFTAPAVGSGEYLFERWEADGRVLFAPNPRAEPYTRLTQLIGVPVTPDEAAARLRQGSLQIATDLPLAAAGEALPGFRTRRAPGDRVIGLTGVHGRLGDPRVRRALLQALDRQSLIDTHAGGHGRVTDSLLFAPDWATPAELRYRRDPEQARALLARAGWKPGTALRIVALFGDPDPGIWQAMAEQWRSVGVEASIQVRSPADRAAVLADRQVDAVIEAHLMPSPEPSLIAPWVSCMTAADPLGPNPGGFCDPRLDQALQQAAAYSLPGQRQQAFAEVADLLSAELPVIPLWVPDTVQIVAEQYTGSPVLLVPSTVQLEDWGLRQG